jgi:hypothetical protein
MFCSQCGAPITDENALLCPSCGHALNAYSTPDDGKNHNPDKAARIAKRRRRKNNRVMAGLAICLILGLAAGAMVFFINASNDSVFHGRIEIQTINDGEYFELSGNFLSEEEIFSVSLTSDGAIAFALSDEISSNNVYYHWLLFDNDHVASTNTFMYTKYTGERLDKAEPVLYYIVPKPGEYDVSVDCYAEEGGEQVYNATYSGKVTYMGNITKNYTWRYRGNDYNAKVTFSYDEYRQFSHMNINGRAVNNYNRISSFVTYDDAAIIKLSNSLREAYGVNKNTTDQDFAQFVLSFVQLCFDYPSSSNFVGADMYQYGHDEYFAYPLETIFYGMGDCEDTSILCTALLMALGYSGGVVIVPGHATSAVGLYKYAPEPYSSTFFEIIQQTKGDITYYACETTIDSPQGIGLMNIYGYNGVPYSQYIGKIGYGFYIVDSDPLESPQDPIDDGFDTVLERI